MTHKTLRTVFVAALILSPAFLAPAPPATALQFRYGTRRSPLAGRRYETMRALAHYLDERAQQAVTQAAAAGNVSSREEEKLRGSISEFAQRAADFHRRMDAYVSKPWELPNEIVELDGLAQRLGTRIYPAPVLRSMYGDWRAILDVLYRMRQVLAGQDVQVPRAHSGFGDYDRDYQPFQGQPAPYDWRQGNLQQFRNLVRQLDDVTTQAHADAERYLPSYPADRDHPEALHRFNDDTRDLRRRADANQVDPREVRFIVDRLREEARRTDREMRSTGVYREVWDEWTRAMSILDQMSQLVAN